MVDAALAALAGEVRDVGRRAEAARAGYSQLVSRLAPGPGAEGGSDGVGSLAAWLHATEASQRATAANLDEIARRLLIDDTA